MIFFIMISAIFDIVTFLSMLYAIDRYTNIHNMLNLAISALYCGAVLRGGLSFLSCGIYETCMRGHFQYLLINTGIFTKGYRDLPVLMRG